MLSCIVVAHAGATHARTTAGGDCGQVSIGKVFFNQHGHRVGTKIQWLALGVTKPEHDRIAFHDDAIPFVVNRGGARGGDGKWIVGLESKGARAHDIVRLVVWKVLHQITFEAMDHHAVFVGTNQHNLFGPVIALVGEAHGRIDVDGSLRVIGSPPGAHYQGGQNHKRDNERKAFFHARPLLYRPRAKQPGLKERPKALLGS